MGISDSGGRGRGVTPGRFVLGVTGNIATGKSTVTGMLAGLGAVVIDSDLVYRELVAPGQPLLCRLTERFGDGIVAKDGGLDRAALGRIVFSDPEALANLDRITHPAVIAEVDRRVDQLHSGVIVLDAVKLIESGHAERCDAVWVVVTAPEVQVSRLTKRNRLLKEEAERRVTAQPPLGPKLERADLVIDNNGTIERTREQVMHGWDALALPFPKAV
ncbi:MAG: dephospho-CoA kinase [Chloroflexia bacterium]|nr:dephospho-CoA kinase [Chloroflexia bacterium]